MNKGKLLLTKSSYELVKPFLIIVKVVVVMETDGNEEYYVYFCKTSPSPGWSEMYTKSGMGHLKNTQTNKNQWSQV